MLKVGVIFFHSKIKSIYPDKWIDKCVDSILSQTIKDFSVYEINYGGDEYSVFRGRNSQIQHFFISAEMKNHAEAMNFIIDKAFEDGCDYVFNTNLDDFYSNDRIEKQIEVLESGFDLVSSDFCYIQDDGESDVITFYKTVSEYGPILENINSGHNIIAHPCVAMGRKFWEGNRYVPEEIPREDLRIWQRAINSGYKFYIIPENLLFYRIHGNQITSKNKPQVETRYSKKHDGDQKKSSSTLKNIRYDF